MAKQDKYQDNGQADSDQQVGRYSSKAVQFVLLSVYMLKRPYARGAKLNPVGVPEYFLAFAPT